TLSPNGKLLFLALCTFIKGGVTSFGDSEVESQVATIATRTQSVDVARPREDGTIGLGNGFIVLGRGEFIENGNHWIGGGKVPRPSQSVALTGTIVNPSAAPADD
ncbi:MAG: hypothetical protein LBB38_03215, partial [Puniceicoccales bacterium]|nr:hypothetical protein [Puniceicoccales bacterium]